MENFKVIGHDWETIYNEDVLSMEIKLNKKYYEPIKQAYENEQIIINLNSNTDKYSSHFNLTLYAYKVLEPIWDDLQKEYIKYNINLIMNNEKELNKFVLNNDGQCLIGYDDEGDKSFSEIREMFFEIGLMDKKLELLLKDNDLKDFIEMTWDTNMDLNYVNDPAIRFEDFNFTTHWSLIYINGVL